MNENQATEILQAGCDAGADFAELFIEETRSAGMTYRDRKLESATVGTTYGVGLRLIYGTEVLYGHTSDDSVENLVRMARLLASQRTSGPRKAPGVRLGFPHRDDRHAPQVLPRSVEARRRLELLLRADRTARELSSEVTQVTASLIEGESSIALFNSEGLSVQEDRVRCRMSLNITAGSGSERISAHEAPGALRGFEFLEGLDVEAVARGVGERALRMLKAGHISGGQMPVIMGNGFGGVIFHEACGHPLETESVRKGASPFGDKIGQPIGQPCLTAIDDGTLPHLWGSLALDDEGMPTQRTTLIEKGVLRTFLSDRVGAAETGVARSGSARRESYKYAPVSRMRNTHILPGESRLEEMMASVDEGLYARKLGGGSVNPATGEFNFAVEEGWKIVGGKLAEPVRGATLIGKGHEVLPLISMVGDDFEAAAGMCGASSGAVPVTVGQPSLKVDRILVGGR